MTPTKILARLVEYGPAAIAQIKKPGLPCCVLATRIGLDVLNRFGIDAVAVPVVVDVANTAFLAWREAGDPGGVEEYERRRCWWLTNRPDAADARIIRKVPAPWGGHLVVGVRGQILDLDAQQFTREPYHITPPPALALAWDGARAAATFPWGGILYQAWPTAAPLDDWRTAKDWHADVTDTIDTLVTRIRKGRPTV